MKLTTIGTILSSTDQADLVDLDADTLDFSGVTGMSPTFMQALLTRRDQECPDKKLRVINVTKRVAATIKVVKDAW